MHAHKTIECGQGSSHVPGFFSIFFSSVEVEGQPLFLAGSFCAVTR